MAGLARNSFRHRDPLLTALVSQHGTPDRIANRPDPLFGRPTNIIHLNKPAGICGHTAVGRQKAFRCWAPSHGHDHPVHFHLLRLSLPGVMQQQATGCGADPVYSGPEPNLQCLLAKTDGRLRVIYANQPGPESPAMPPAAAPGSRVDSRRCRAPTPMTPAPIIPSLSGTRSKFRAPVESTIICPS